MSRTASGVTTGFCFDSSSVVLEKQGSTTTAAYTYGKSLLTRGSETMHLDGWCSQELERRSGSSGAG